MCFGVMLWVDITRKIVVFTNEVLTKTSQAKLPQAAHLNLSTSPPSHLVPPPPDMLLAAIHLEDFPDIARAINN